MLGSDLSGADQPIGNVLELDARVLDGEPLLIRVCHNHPSKLLQRNHSVGKGKTKFPQVHVSCSIATTLQAVLHKRLLEHIILDHVST